MKVISYVASLLCLYLLFQGWSFLWDIHFLLPLGILVAMLTTGMVFIVTAETRKKARSHRMFEEMCDRYDGEKWSEEKVR
jgi:F0F1-type ATP synthase assembly protein I